MHSLRFFSNAEVAERLAYPQLIEALRIGLAKPCSAPLRNCHALPAQASLLQMPVWQAGAGIGVKLVTVFPGNGARGLPAGAAVFALFGCARRWRRPIASVALPPPAKRWCAAHG